MNLEFGKAEVKPGSPYDKKGWTKWSKFKLKFTGEIVWLVENFTGETVWLVEDDESDFPAFGNDRGYYYYYGLDELEYLGEFPPEEGWLPWGGGDNCPVPNGTPTWVKFRNGEVVYGDDPQDWRWYHLDDDGDIVAFRTNDPSEAVSEDTHCYPTGEEENVSKELTEPSGEPLVKIEATFSIKVGGQVLILTSEEFYALKDEVEKW